MKEPEQQKTGASLNRGRSFQAYQTPREFIAAVEHRFGPLDWDLAATVDNAVSHNFIGPDADSLTQDWTACEGLRWLNPPFADIEPWASKCAASAVNGYPILLLVPASVGSNWFAEHVLPHALVYALRPRLSFDRKNPFPRDLLLAAYGYGVSGFTTWKWKEITK